MNNITTPLFFQLQNSINHEKTYFISSYDAFVNANKCATNSGRGK